MATTGNLCETRAETTFEWKIEDFSSLPAEKNTYYGSPPFFCSGIAWKIWFYPNGDTTAPDGWTSLYLKRISSGYPVTMDYTVSLKSSVGKEAVSISSTATFFQKFQGWGASKFISRSTLMERKSDLTPSGLLTVICTIKNNEAYNIESSYISELQKFSDDLKKIYVDAKKTDFLFKTNDGKLHAHRLMLETRSPVFAAMLRHDTKENQTGEVSVIDIDKESLEAILLYIYSGDTKRLTPDNVFRIYAAAEKYDVKYVKEICSQFIIRNLSIESVCDVIKFSETYKDKEVGKRAREYFKENADKILETDNWENFVKENHNISVELLATVVKTLFKK